MSRIMVVPYQPQWPAAFERAAREVKIALRESLLAIHHIGSTSIPGIHAKPIIDMLAVAGSLSRIDELAERMREIGYEVMGEFGIPGRRYFRRDNAAGVRTEQVHTFAAESPHVRRHLAFRDSCGCTASWRGSIRNSSSAWRRPIRQLEDLEETLGNLLDNAFKWGKSAIQIESTQQSGTISICVDDDGPGLPASKRVAVLQRGIRADEAAPGWGLGLAIARELAEVYGGDLSLVDSPKGGVRAQLRLPARMG